MPIVSGLLWLEYYRKPRLTSARQADRAMINTRNHTMAPRGKVISKTVPTKVPAIRIGQRTSIWSTSIQLEKDNTAQSSRTHQRQIDKNQMDKRQPMSSAPQGRQVTHNRVLLLLWSSDNDCFSIRRVDHSECRRIHLRRSSKHVFPRRRSWSSRCHESFWVV